jgi:drug/metabolite transporter (DMT)-like permease
MLLKNYLQILLTSSLWGSSFLLMKFALDELDPFQIAFYRILIGMIFINSLRFEKVKISYKDHFYTAIVGILWMSLPFYLFAESEKTITSSLAGLVNGSTPIFISMFAVLFFKQRISNIKKVYLFSGFVGIYILTFGFQIANLELNKGIVLALLASISYGLAANIVQPLIKTYGALNTTRMVLRYASLFSFILFSLNSDYLLPTLEGSLPSILILGIGGSGIAFLSFYKLIDDVGAIFGSITVYIIPIFSVIFGYLFLNETTSLSQISGIIVIVLSAYLFTGTND